MFISRNFKINKSKYRDWNLNDIAKDKYDFIDWWNNLIKLFGKLPPIIATGNEIINPDRDSYYYTLKFDKLQIGKIYL